MAVFSEIRVLIPLHAWEIYLDHTKINGTVDGVAEFENLFKKLINQSCEKYNFYPLKFTKVEVMQNMIINTLTKHMPSLIIHFQRLLASKNEGYGDVNTFKQKETVGVAGYDAVNQNGDFSNTKIENINNNFNNYGLLKSIMNTNLNPFNKIVKEIVDEVCTLIWR